MIWVRPDGVEPPEWDLEPDVMTQEERDAYFTRWFGRYVSEVEFAQLDSWHPFEIYAYASQVRH